MAKGRLRRYDVQADYAFVLSLLSIVPFILAAVLAIRNYDGVIGKIVYGSNSLFVPAFGACLLFSMIPAGIGSILGWNSAGQRRNDNSARSWSGFFVGGFILTFDLILAIAFFMLRLSMSI